MATSDTKTKSSMNSKLLDSLSLTYKMSQQNAPKKTKKQPIGSSGLLKGKFPNFQPALYHHNVGIIQAILNNESWYNVIT